MTPRDPHGDGAAPGPRPVFAQPRLLLFVFLGGAIGSAGREGIALLFASSRGIPWAILVVNVVGALLLGFLLTALRSRTPESATRRDVRLFAGTGILGGFTTYSALATDMALLFASEAALAIVYAVGSVALGIAAAWAGIVLAARAFPAEPAPAEAET